MTVATPIKVATFLDLRVHAKAALRILQEKNQRDKTKYYRFNMGYYRRNSAARMRLREMNF